MNDAIIISIGIIAAVPPDTDVLGIDWRPKFEELGFRLNGPIAVRPLDRRYDVPTVLDMHDGDPISFEPQTQFVSLTAPVIKLGTMAPEYDGEEEVTALTFTGPAFSRSRKIVDKDDAKKGHVIPSQGGGGGLIIKHPDADS